MLIPVMRDNKTLVLGLSLIICLDYAHSSEPRASAWDWAPMLTFHLGLQWFSRLSTLDEISFEAPSLNVQC
jgi:hypothetical protein